jgi:hypothetical protein
MKMRILLLMLLVLFGCGEDKNPTEPEVWKGNTNSFGFPDVSGTFSFTTNQFNGSCSDGSKATSPAITFNIIIVQTDGNLIEGFGTDSTEADPEGYTMISGSGLKGTVEKSDGNSAKFILTNKVVYDVKTSQYTGRMTLNYNITGKFTDKTWTGEYIYQMYLSIGNCKYTTTFRGDKIENALPKVLKKIKLPILMRKI